MRLSVVFLGMALAGCRGGGSGSAGSAASSGGAAGGSSGATSAGSSSGAPSASSSGATGTPVPACAGQVTVTQGLLAGGDAGVAIAATAFFPFGARVLLTSTTACSQPPVTAPGITVSSATLELDLPADAGPGTYSFSPDGGAPFPIRYAFNTPYLGGSVGGGILGTITLDSVDPATGVVGSYDLNFSASGIGLVESCSSQTGCHTVGPLIEQGAFTAPVCNACGLGAGSVTDAGPASDSVVSACDAYYAAQYTRCGGPQLPAKENARQRQRFEEFCADQLALPGSGETLSSLMACVQAIEASSCEDVDGLPLACSFVGTLPPGSTCMDSVQCSVGACGGMQDLSPAGPLGPEVCGTCPTGSAPVGASCGELPCASGALCVLSQPGGSTYACKAITVGASGAACDGLTALCDVGLACISSACQPLLGSGAPCQAGQCAPPLACIQTNGPSPLPFSGLCGLSGDGGPCDSDVACSPGLGCTQQRTCAPIAWAGAGDLCDLSTRRCEVGSCGGDGLPFPRPPLPDGGSGETCPQVTPDGASCGGNAGITVTCDAYAACFENVCVIDDALTCQ